MRYAAFLTASALTGTWAQDNEEIYAPKFRRGFLPGSNSGSRLTIRGGVESRGLTVRSRINIRNGLGEPMPTNPTNSTPSATSSSSSPSASSTSGSSTLANVGMAILKVVEIIAAFAIFLLLCRVFGPFIAFMIMCQRKKRSGTCALPENFPKEDAAKMVHDSYGLDEQETVETLEKMQEKLSQKSEAELLQMHEDLQLIDLQEALNGGISDLDQLDIMIQFDEEFSDIIERGMHVQVKFTSKTELFEDEPAFDANVNEPVTIGESEAPVDVNVAKIDKEVDTGIKEGEEKVAKGTEELLAEGAEHIKLRYKRWVY